MDWAQCFNEAIRFLERDLTQPPDVEAAARLAGCSVFHFQRMFAYVADVYKRQKQNSAEPIDEVERPPHEAGALRKPAGSDKAENSLYHYAKKTADEKHPAKLVKIYAVGEMARHFCGLFGKACIIPALARQRLGTADLKVRQFLFQTLFSFVIFLIQILNAFQMRSRCV